jgi:hypothetical protein
MFKFLLYGLAIGAIQGGAYLGFTAEQLNKQKFLLGVMIINALLFWLAGAYSAALSDFSSISEEGWQGKMHQLKHLQHLRGVRYVWTAFRIVSKTEGHPAAVVWLVLVLTIIIIPVLF